MTPVIVLTTVGENHAVRELATELVEQRLAACVNIVPNIYSIFRWRGRSWTTTTLIWRRSKAASSSIWQFSN